MLFSETTTLLEKKKIKSGYGLRDCKNISKFALVNTLERHIEILLLSNDCVMVPGLGGFVAHHICARYVPEEGLFLPPLRTIGFNAQLTLNDSLLAQAYAETFDLSLPQALDRVEAEVAQLKQELADKGSVELADLGRLYTNAEGHVAFEPCEAGILTPSLYGLSSFELAELRQTVKAEEKTAAEKPIINKVETAEPAAADDRAVYIGIDRAGRRTLNVSLRALRNTVAAAAVVTAMFLIPTPLTRDGSQLAQSSQNGAITSLCSTLEQMAGSQADTVRLKKAKPIQAKGRQVKIKAARPNTVAFPVKQDQVTTASRNERTAISGTERVAEVRTERITEVRPERITAPKPSTQQSHYWSIVLCSHVSKAGAEQFVKRLQRDGVQGAEVSEAGGINKVLFGQYKSSAEAQQALSSLRSSNHFQQAWVTEIK